ncbi:MAG: hypothetical protein R3247_08910, partial [Rhodothermales bacterium]|nr:hypothetical protein [Rhodothermales bacterium]
PPGRPACAAPCSWRRGRRGLSGGRRRWRRPTHRRSASPLRAAARALALDASGLPSGLYLIRAEGATFTAARPLTVVR